MKNSKFLITLMILTFTSTFCNNEVIVNSYQINDRLIKYKASFDERSNIKIIIKIDLFADSTKELFNKNKKEIMFSKLNTIKIQLKNSKIISATDYVFEQYFDTYNLVFTIQQTNKNDIDNIIFSDSILTNSKIIKLL